MFSIFNGATLGVWTLGSQGDDIFGAPGAPSPLFGDDVVMAGPGDDFIRAEHGQDLIIGGVGSDIVATSVSGDLILGDDPFSGAAPGDFDEVRYTRSSEGVTVTDIRYGSTLGRDLWDLGLERPGATDAVKGYLVQNTDDKIGDKSLQSNDLDAVLAMGGVDVVLGVERLMGTRFEDTFQLGGHDDIVYAGGGADRVITRGGDDRIFAGDGDDRIVAGRGDDLIVGEGGNDRIRSGDGNDKILFDAHADGHDVILDFDVRSRESENDSDQLVVDFNGVRTNLQTAQQFADFIVFLETDGDGATDALQDGNDLILDFNGASVVLRGVMDDIAGPQYFADAPAQVEATEIDGVAHLWSDVIDIA